MQKLHLFIGSILLLGTVIACSQEEITADNSTDVFRNNITDIQNYATSKGLSGTLINSGLYYATAVANPVGKRANYGDELEFNFTLSVLSGVSNSTVTPPPTTTVVTDRVVDTTFATTPTYFTFYNQSLLLGLEQGLLYTREGERVILLMPSELAFGPEAAFNGLIPANSPVRFDVTLRRSRSENEQITEYIAANKLTVTEQSITGLRFIKTGENPTGAALTAGQTATIKYRGTRLRGTTAFDSTGTGTRDFTLGGNNIPIPALNEGLSKLKVGEKATIIFPSSQGYGTQGRVSDNIYVVPPYAPLRYDLEIVSAK